MSGFFKKKIDRSSPQATVEGFKQALVSKDWSRALKYMSNKAQAGMAGALLMAAAYAADGNSTSAGKLQKIMRKHGLQKHQKVDSENADFAAIVRDLMRWSDKQLPGDAQLNLAENAALTEYGEYRISDDRAYVVTTCNGRQSETRLKCIEQEWYLI